MTRRQNRPGEEILWQGSPSQITNLGTYFFCGITIGLGWVAAIFCWQWPPVRDHNFSGLVLGGLLIICLGSLWMAFWQWLQVKSNSYTITTERILISQGILNRKTEEIELYRVRDVTLVQPLFLRLFGLSTLELMTTDPSSPTIVLEAVHEARMLWDEMRRCAEMARQKRGIAEIDFT
ncbi:hypothetical protein BST81_12985 [Leptolyngbya sp. 'hensonii']|uniref:PH domain-containing protein n=1 Tax=Leptolyngbya sp. 'hensonii' TaxID=1922337 RepID=UPI00094FB972|nr:PH domain-containing protein [Leptolyngbya sp. 'hensonii']OLP17961.1 hypothetical protein BST81_12985 [Leptolyngbya sp. 'hensonii']